MVLFPALLCSILSPTDPRTQTCTVTDRTSISFLRITSNWCRYTLVYRISLRNKHRQPLYTGPYVRIYLLAPTSVNFCRKRPFLVQGVPCHLSPHSWLHRQTINRLLANLSEMRATLKRVLRILPASALGKPTLAG